MRACSVDGCHTTAVSWLRFAGMGEQLHVHVCAAHEAEDREYADVIESGPMPCPERLACGPSLFHAQPPLLDA